MTIKEQAAERGHTVRITASSTGYDLTLWVAPDTDYDTRFIATCDATGEVLKLAGWNWEIEQ